MSRLNAAPVIGIMTAHMDCTASVPRSPARTDPFRRLGIHVLGKSFAPLLYVYNVALSVSALIFILEPVCAFVREG